MSWSKITIITPSLNRVEFIREAIESVIRQNYPNVEHIVVDGGSTDGTLDVLAEYSHLKIISEPDLGMYDALNKGLNIATGEWIGFLNTDDFYEDLIFSTVADLFNRNQLDAVAGQTTLFLQNENGKDSVIRQSKILTKRQLWRELIHANPGFNGWFFKRRVFEQLGRFDSTYRISGDRDFLIRFLLSDITYALVDQLICNYRVHESSLTFSQSPSRLLQMVDENLRIVEQYVNLVPKKVSLDLKQHRTRTTISAFARYLSIGSYRKAIYYMQMGCHYDSLWFIKFFFGSFRGIFREIERKFGFYLPF